MRKHKWVGKELHCHASVALTEKRSSNMGEQRVVKLQELQYRYREHFGDMSGDAKPSAWESGNS